MLIYTSGTTGEPKGAVHTHCGFPVKAAQDMAHCMDVRSTDTVYWITDMGWMMGPWLVFGATLLGATIVLYEGAPDYPAPDRLWSLVERHRVTVLGVSPTLIRALMQHGEDPVRHHDLSSLRILSSTGEPWNPDPWNWFFRVVGRGRLPILNYSGGTEISGGILCGNLLLPLKPTAFSGPIPGHRRGRRGRERQLRPPASRRAGHPPSVDRHDARLLGTSLTGISKPIGPASPACGPTATGPPLTPTACGISSAARTTPSRSPASASVRPKSSPSWLLTRPSRKPSASVCPTRSKARRSSASACSGRAMSQVIDCAQNCKN